MVIERRNIMKRDDNIQNCYERSLALKEADRQIQNLFEEYGCLEAFNDFKKASSSSEISDDQLNSFFSCIQENFPDEDRALLMFLWANISNLI